MLNGSEGIGRGRDRNKDNTDRQKALFEVACSIEPFVQEAFKSNAHNRGSQERERQRRQKRPAKFIRQGDGDIASEHGEAAMRQIDEIHHPQSDGEPH